MTVRPSYRIDQSQISGVSYSDSFVEQQIEAGWLIPDTRLQAIADAYQARKDATGRGAEIWQEASKKFFDLVDALTEEEQ